MPTVKLNGEERSFLVGTTVASIVEELGCGVRGIAAALNEVVIPRSEWQRAMISDGDSIEILHAVGGG